ncbi:MAG: hypothetical protein E7613_07870 [Ruminococcaceae bacterium]|nr:hypothetical protein [Oscillospiraceae bacterium]
MKRKILYWQLSALVCVAIGGTLLHFLYTLTNKSPIVAPFSGVNESTWEHMKLLYFPLFVFAIIQSRFFKEFRGFWCVKAIGISTGLILIPILFYTYNGAFGKSPDWLNITMFFVAAALSLLLETHLFLHKAKSYGKKAIPLIFIVLWGILFVVFTFYTPQLPLFKSPTDGTYGIK